MKRKLLTMLSVCLLLILASLAVAEESNYAGNKKESLDRINRELCRNVLCHSGQDCLVTKGIASCICKKSCPGHENPVCGSNGMTFPNHCELHRTACLQGKKIAIKHRGICKGRPTPSQSLKNVTQSKPVVCLEDDRDDIRSRIIGWLRTQNNSQEALQDYKNLLKSYFDLMDEDNNGRLDAMEFKEFVQANQTAEMDSTEEEYENSLVQSLCADALISISDDDSDRELNIEEFIKCLDPEFKPPKRDCELDDMIYNDGAEIPTNDCNSCICACGQWVCTALKCDDPEANHVRAKMLKDEEEYHNLVVNGEEARELLSQEISQQNNKQQGHHIQRRVMSLHKPRHPHNNKKHNWRKFDHREE